MPRSADCSAVISTGASLRPTSAIRTPARPTIPTLPRWRARPASRASTSTAPPIFPTRCEPRSRRAGPISSTPTLAPTRTRAVRACGSFPDWARANPPSAAAIGRDRPRVKIAICLTLAPRIRWASSPGLQPNSGILVFEAGSVRRGGPFRRLARDQSGEFLGRATQRLESLRPELGDDLVGGERRIGGSAELFNHAARRGGGRHQTEPDAGLEIGLPRLG